jgi:hypothetical protein
LYFRTFVGWNLDSMKMECRYVIFSLYTDAFIVSREVDWPPGDLSWVKTERMPRFRDAPAKFYGDAATYRGGGSIPGIGWFDAVTNRGSVLWHGNTKGLVLKHWLLIGVTGLPVAFMIYRRLHRPYPAGLCANCGYDLRASPYRCPECGLVPKASRGR